MGGNKMDKDLKTIAKFLAKKIEEAKDEIIETIDARFDEFSQEEEP